MCVDHFLSVHMCVDHVLRLHMEMMWSGLKSITLKSLAHARKSCTECAHVAVCCSVLQCVAVCCSVLQCARKSCTECAHVCRPVLRLHMQMMRCDELITSN